MWNQIKKIIITIGVDKAIAYSSGSRIISAGAGIITIFFISSFFSGVEQGYYYTFGSIVALQVFFELGLTNILSQFAASENAHIEWNNTTIINRGTYHHSRLAHLIKFTKKWYAVTALILLLMLIVGGILFFLHYSQGESYNLWLWPWLLVTSATAANLFISPFLSILSGVNKIKEIARIMFYQQIIAPLFIWGAVLCHANLYSVGIGYWIQFIVSVLMVRLSSLWDILRELKSTEINEKISYRREIFPYQWKIAISWASGYFVFQLFNPVLFATSGAVAAGKMGMTLSAVNGIASLSSSWISTKVPLFSRLIALKDYLSLDRIFNKTMCQLGIICGLMLIMLWGVIAILQYLNINIATRFIGLLPLALLEIAILANQYGNGWATYLRCHLQEPLLLNSIIGAVTCGLSTIILGSKYGIIGMTGGYCALRIILTEWNFTVYKRKKQEWHN